MDSKQILKTAWFRLPYTFPPPMSHDRPVPWHQSCQRVNSSICSSNSYCRPIMIVMTTIVVGTRTTMMTVVIMRVKMLVRVVGTITYNSSVLAILVITILITILIVFIVQNVIVLTRKILTVLVIRVIMLILVIVVLGTVRIRTELGITMMVMRKISMVHAKASLMHTGEILHTCISASVFHAHRTLTKFASRMQPSAHTQQENGSRHHLNTPDVCTWAARVAYVYVYVYVYVCVCIYIYICVCVCVRACLHDQCRRRRDCEINVRSREFHVKNP